MFIILNTGDKMKKIFVILTLAITFPASIFAINADTVEVENIEIMSIQEPCNSGGGTGG